MRKQPHLGYIVKDLKMSRLERSSFLLQDIERRSSAECNFGHLFGSYGQTLGWWESRCTGKTTVKVGVLIGLAAQASL